MSACHVSEYDLGRGHKLPLDTDIGLVSLTKKKSRVGGGVETFSLTMMNHTTTMKPPEEKVLSIYTLTPLNLLS